MQFEFPRLLFRCPGKLARAGGTYDHTTANDGDEAAELLSNGWYPTLPEAIAAAAPKPEAKKSEPFTSAPLMPAQSFSIPDDNAEPTREELLEKCAELGIEADGRWGTGRLNTEIMLALRRKARDAMV